MSPRFIVWSALVFSWFTTFLIGKKNFKKYTPVALLATLCVTIVYAMAFHLGWWKLKNPLISWLKSLDLSFILGPFFVGTIWVFSLTYRFGFRVYLIANLILDAFFTYLFVPILENIGVVKLKRISKTRVLGLMTFVAIIIYPFQKWQDGKLF